MIHPHVIQAFPFPIAFPGLEPEFQGHSGPWHWGGESIKNTWIHAKKLSSGVQLLTHQLLGNPGVCLCLSP